MNRTLLGFLITTIFAGVASAADFATEVQDATFKLFHPSWTSTCFFVRRNAPDTALYLVTAGHALEGIKADTAIVVLRKPKEDGSYERYDHKITIRRNDKPLWVRHEKQDVAVLRIVEPPPVAVAALPLSLIADAGQLNAAGVHICSPLFVLSYPQRFEANDAGFPAARQGIFASPPLLPIDKYPTFLADFTTFAGDSGGPVFIAGPDGHALLVGIVLAQFRHDERLNSEYDERTIHYPLGLGRILHAQYIRETLDAAAKQDAPISK